MRQQDDTISRQMCSVAAYLLATCLLVACGGGANTAEQPSGSQSPPPPGTNAAPSISGSPQGSVAVGSTYNFQPAASDPESNTLTFSIANMPTWTSFAANTGRLTGVPTASNVGAYPGIVISVSDGTSSVSLPAFSITVSAALTTNRPPVITGTPSGAVVVGATYNFQPTASDPDANTLTFTIQNLPSWATFAAATGRLTGSPTAANVGTYSGVTVSVSDGVVATALPPFSIVVTQAATGSLVLNWTAPNLRSDGTALTNLSGYQISYGSGPSDLTQTVQISNPSVSTYTVGNLTTGTWYFALRAVAADGQSSAPTNLVTGIVQ